VGAVFLVLLLPAASASTVSLENQKKDRGNLAFISVDLWLKQ
jgi:hypothetical protein